MASLIGLGMASPNPAFTTMTTTLALSGKYTKYIKLLLTKNTYISIPQKASYLFRFI